MNEISEHSTVPQRPYLSVVLALSADGKISDRERSHPTFGSKQDYAHLERQVAAADASLGGAGTLRAGGTAMLVKNPDLIRQRVESGKSEQPIKIICSHSGDFDPTLRFFRQPMTRYLLTTAKGAQQWGDKPGFEQVIITSTIDDPAQDHPEQDRIDWKKAMQILGQHSIKRIAVLGGGEIVASLLAADVIDELHLTLCPILIGGKSAPSAVDGYGFLQAQAPRLALVNVTRVEDELFLQYQVRRSP